MNENAPYFATRINYGLPIENSGLMYQVLNLRSNLTQRGNDKKVKNFSKCDFKLGDHVTATNLKGKSVSGHIQIISYNDDNSIRAVLLLDDKTKMITPVKYDSLEIIKITESKKDMKNKKLVEGYYNDSTEQMNSILKSSNKSMKKYQEEYEERKNMICSILGKATYNKFNNNGIFAPVPLSALHLTLEDFAKLQVGFNYSKFPMNNAITLVGYISKNYYRNTFKIIDNGYTNIINTDIVFKTLDEIIDFFMIVEKLFIKVYKTRKMNWTAIVRKFRNYLK